MNERFKTLWFEAAESTSGDSWEEQTAFMERFAELIVRECADLVMNDENAFDVLKHFGVEE